MEKPSLKAAITESAFFKFDDLEVNFLRTELGVLLDNLSRVNNAVSGKVAAKGKEAEDTAIAKSNEEKRRRSDAK